MEDNNLVLNLAEVDESKAGFEAIPKGSYECIIKDVEYTLSKTSNAPMLTWKYEVVDGEYEKRMLFHHTGLTTDFGLASLKKSIIACGVDVNFASFNPQEFADNGDAIGLPVLLKVGIQMYDGKKTNNVKEVLSSKTVGKSWS